MASPLPPSAIPAAEAMEESRSGVRIHVDPDLLASLGPSRSSPSPTSKASPSSAAAAADCYNFRGSPSKRRRKQPQFSRRLINSRSSKVLPRLSTAKLAAGPPPSRQEHERLPSRLARISTPAALHASVAGSLFAEERRHVADRSKWHEEEWGMEDDEREAELQAQMAEQKMLKKWTQSYDVEILNYDSVAVFSELRLREALNSTSALGVPNKVRTAVVCDLLLKILGIFGRFSDLTATLCCEVMRCIYGDYDHEKALQGGATSMFTMAPFFAHCAKRDRENTRLRKELKLYENGLDIRGELEKRGNGILLLSRINEATLKRLWFRAWRQSFQTRKNAQIVYMRRKKDIWFRAWKRWLVAHRRQTRHKENKEHMELQQEAIDALKTRNAELERLTKRQSNQLVAVYESFFDAARDCQIYHTEDGEMKPADPELESLEQQMRDCNNDLVIQELSPAWKNDGSKPGLAKSLRERILKVTKHKQFCLNAGQASPTRKMTFALPPPTTAETTDASTQTDGTLGPAPAIAAAPPVKRVANDDSSEQAAATEQPRKLNIFALMDGKQGKKKKRKKDKPMSVENAKELVSDIYQARVISDIHDDRKHTKRPDMPEFVMNHLIMMSGLKALASRALRQLVARLRREEIKEDAQLSFFRRLLGVPPKGASDDDMSHEHKPRMAQLFSDLLRFAMLSESGTLEVSKNGSDIPSDWRAPGLAAFFKPFQPVKMERGHLLVALKLTFLQIHLRDRAAYDRVEADIRKMPNIDLRGARELDEAKRKWSNDHDVHHVDIHAAITRIMEEWENEAELVQTSQENQAMGKLKNFFTRRRSAVFAISAMQTSLEENAQNTFLQETHAKNLSLEEFKSALTANRKNRPHLDNRKVLQLYSQWHDDVVADTNFGASEDQVADECEGDNGEASAAKQADKGARARDQLRSAIKAAVFVKTLTGNDRHELEINDPVKLNRLDRRNRVQTILFRTTAKNLARDNPATISEI